MAEAKESKAGDAGGDVKRSRTAFHDVEEDEEGAVLGDDAKKPPLRANVGWGQESTLPPSDDKHGNDYAEPGDHADDSPTTETKRPGRRRKGSETAGSAGGERRNQKNRYFDEDDEATDIMEIPDLEEEEREPDIITQVAAAPRNTTRAVQSLKQLDKDIKFALPTASTHGVDLNLLTSALCPERAVAEADETWEFDLLLNEISQEIQKDLDDKEDFLRAEAAATAPPAP